MKMAAPRIGYVASAMKWIVLLLLLPAASVFCAAPQKLSEWMASFHLTRDISRFDEFWRRAVEKGAFDARPQIRESTIAFLSRVFHEHPELLKGRIDSVQQFPEDQRDAVRVLLWLADTESAREVLRKSGDEDMLKIKPPAIAHRAIQYPYDNDFCEGWFFATGDTDALRPMLDLLAKSDWDPKDLRPGAATVILREICRQDAAAREFVEDFARDQKLGDNAREAILVVLGKAGPKAGH